MAERTKIDHIDKFYFVFFFLSLLSSALCTVFYLAMLLYGRFGDEKRVKALVLITIRGILSSAVSSAPGDTLVKLAVIIIISGLVLLSPKYAGKNQRRLDLVVALFVVYGIYVFFISFFNSSYPVTSIFKLISFGVPFVAILKGVAKTNSYCNWEDYLASILTVLMFISFCTIPFGRFRITNGSFQGVFNHVNMFGIIAALYVAVLLTSSLFTNKPVIKISLVMATFIMIFLSASRTGMFTGIAVVFLYFMFNKRKNDSFIKSLMVFTLVAVSVIVLIQPSLFDKASSIANAFIFKGYSGNILFSRVDQMATTLAKYENNPLFGSGFMVPLSYSEVNYSLRYDLMVEPGNIIMCVLGDTGIIGLTLFSIVLLSILCEGDKNKLYLMVAALLINMGEMVFFSTNNMSVLCYILIAMYLFKEDGSAEMELGERKW